MDEKARRHLLVQTRDLGLAAGALGAKRAQRCAELPDQVRIVALQLLHARLHLLPLQRQLSRSPAKTGAHATSAKKHHMHKDDICTRLIIGPFSGSAAKWKKGPALCASG